MWLGFAFYTLDKLENPKRFEQTRAELEFYRKNAFCPRFDRSSLSFDRLSQAEMHSNFYISSIPTLHKRYNFEQV